MSDIAEIGFKADTSDLSDAKIKLDQLSPAAAKVEGNVDRLNSTMERLIKSMERSTSRASRGVSANDNLGKSYAKLESTMDRVNRIIGTSRSSAMAQGASYDALGQKITSLRSKYNPLFAVIHQYKANIADIRQANALGAISVNEMTEAISRQRRAALTAIGAIKGNAAVVQKFGEKSGIARHNVGNLAAQFQDIGVTAAMGMNPMMVALQQGTQISAVLGPLGMSGAVKSLGAAFKAVISPLSLMTIAFTALAVVLIQMVDWSAFAKNSLNALADVLPTVATYAALAAAALALMYAPAIMRSAAALPGLVLKLSKRIWGLAASLYATVGLPVLLVAGFVAIVAAANVFRDDLTRILGFDIVDAAKTGVNYIIGTFVGGYKAISAAWGVMPVLLASIMLDVANGIIKKFKEMFVWVIDTFNSVRAKFGKEPIELIIDVDKDAFENNMKDFTDKTLGEMMSIVGKAQGEDYIGGIVTGIENGANKASEKLRKIANGIGSDDSNQKEKTNSFAKIVSGSESGSESVRAEIKGLNMSAVAARALKNETDLLNKARNAGIALTPVQTTQLKELAATYTALQNTLENGKFIKEMNIASENNIISLQAEREALGLVGVELEKFKAKTETLAAIKNANLTLTDSETQALLKQAEAVAILNAQNAIDKSFTDQSSALKESILNQQTEIEALSLTAEAAAALRFERKLLNDEMFRGIKYSPTQIADLKDEAAALHKMQEEYSQLEETVEFAKSTTKSFFSDLKGDISEGISLIQSFGNAFANVLDKISDKILNSGIDALFEDLKIDDFIKKNIGGIASFLGFAKGGAFESGSQKFAKGGTFTNSVVSKPTLFQFAKGGKLGEMGEAGPEAIMPLKRGSDGSLGVQMYGASSGSSSSTSVTEVSMPITINADGADAVTLEKVVTEIKDLKENFPNYMRSGQREINNMGG